jgi:hypothetical protein
VNQPNIHLGENEGPSNSATFNNNINNA